MPSLWNEIFEGLRKKQNPADAKRSQKWVEDLLATKEDKANGQRLAIADELK